MGTFSFSQGRRREKVGVRIGVLLVATLLFPSPFVAWAAAQPTHHLRGSDGLARAYDTILDARSPSQIEIELGKACPPAPLEACQILRVTGTWWRIQRDPNNRALDAGFLQDANAAVAISETWTAREPGNAEAWFYLGAAYALRVQFRVLRNEKVSAARDGKRIKQALERSIALDPQLNDAYFGIGLYEYYADVAPAAAKFLRWLLLLPGGNKERGLERMLRTQSSGELLRGEADFQLHVIYLWYENRPDRALELLDNLHDRHPTNALFPLLMADIQDTYLHDPTAALATYASVLSAAREDRVSEPRLAETQARIGMARQLDMMVETDRAIDYLKGALELRPEAPYSARALAALRLGAAYDRMGQRELASAAYRSAIAATPTDDPLGIVEQANQALSRRPDPRIAQAYRLSIEGWRAIGRRELGAAETALTESLAIKPDDPVTQYRYGRLLMAQGEPDAALVAFDRALKGKSNCPPTILAAAYLDAGQLHERAGRRDRAATMYRSASGVFGASAETKARARRLLARVSAALGPSARAPRQ
jgi:tetratricopeptide (TPR) repeat protein